MSAIACDPQELEQGRGYRFQFKDSFNDQISQALALKLDLKTTQLVNEKALQKLAKAKGSAESLKQALQARAAIYVGDARPLMVQICI